MKETCLNFYTSDDLLEWLPESWPLQILDDDPFAGRIR